MLINWKKAIALASALMLIFAFLSPALAEKAVPGKITVMIFDRGNIPGSQGDAANNRWTQWVKDNAPVEVAFVPVARAEADQILVNLFAAGEAPDYIPYGSNPQAFVTNGMAMKVTDEMLEKVPNYLKRISNYPEVDKAASFNGVRYGFGRAENVFHNHSIVIRKDWLDNLGLSIPETTDDLLTIAHAFTYGDPDGNGEQDTWGTSMTTDSQRIYAHMWGVPWPEKYVFDDDGSLVYVWDRIESWIGFLKALIDDGCVNPDFMLMKGDDDRVDFLNDRIGIYAQARFSQAGTGLNLYRDFKAMNPEAELVSFALPATEYGRYIAHINGGVSYAGFINPNTQNLDGVLAYVNWLMDPEVEEYLSFGPIGEYFTKNHEGTYCAIAPADVIEAELSWSPFFDAGLDLNGDEGVERFVSDQYNQYLSASDEVSQEFGVLFYQMCCIANEPGALEPRKWQQFLPVLPKELNLIKVTAGTAVEELLSAALVNRSLSAGEAVAQAHTLWEEAGGQRVDEYYAQYYATAGDTALRMIDFEAMKATPQLTQTAQAVYERLTSE